MAVRVELKWSPTLVRPQLTCRTTSPACDTYLSRWVSHATGLGRAKANRRG